MRRYERSLSAESFAANADALVDGLSRDEQPTVITVNGMPKAVLVDMASYEELQETLALLQISAMGEQEVREGKYVPLEEAFRSIRRRTAE